MSQAQEYVLVQALVSELAVEGLDISVLHGSSWLDEVEHDASALCPGCQTLTDKLRTVVDGD